MFISFVLRNEEKDDIGSGGKRCPFLDSYIEERKMDGGEAGNKSGERWADPVVSRAAELRLGRLFFRPAGLI